MDLEQSEDTQIKSTPEKQNLKEPGVQLPNIFSQECESEDRWYCELYNLQKFRENFISDRLS